MRHGTVLEQAVLRLLADGRFPAPIGFVLIKYLLDAQEKPVTDLIVLVAVVRVVPLGQGSKVNPSFSEVDARAGCRTRRRRWYGLIDDDQRYQKSQIDDGCPYSDLSGPESEWVDHDCGTQHRCQVLSFEGAGCDSAATAGSTQCDLAIANA